MSNNEESIKRRLYLEDGERRAGALENRGPLRFESSGQLAREIREAYEHYGFYVFEGVVDEQEIREVEAELDDVIERAPASKNGGFDKNRRPALGMDHKRPLYIWARPLSDPLGGTPILGGRHAVRMEEPTPRAGAPKVTVCVLQYTFGVMDSALRLSAHPGMLRVAETFAGPDFVPYNDNFHVKEPGLGSSVAWHQDGITHWEHPNWYPGIHGFNLMVQLYRTTPVNALWALPGTHRSGRVDLASLAAQNGGSDRIPDAVPVLCERGDAVICNRQLVHGSFANDSPDRRVTFIWGFFPRDAVLGVENDEGIDYQHDFYDEVRIEERMRIVQIAIDARHRRWPEEEPYRYAPFLGREEEVRWSPELSRTLFRDYGEGRIIL